MEGLECQRKSAFKAPPREWIDFRLEKFHETLSKNTKASALALRDLLGEIELEPVPGECVVENGRLIENRSYYVAHTNIQTLALLDETKGSNWLRCRKRRDSNPRYLAALLFSSPIRFSNSQKSTNLDNNHTSIEGHLSML